MSDKRNWRSGWMFPRAFYERFILAHARAKLREGKNLTQSRYAERLITLGIEREKEQRRDET